MAKLSPQYLKLGKCGKYDELDEILGPLGLQRRNIYSDIGCQYSRSIYTACFIAWQPRRAADTSTNWRQSLFCCCTVSMEQVTDGAETAVIDGLVLSWSENISVSFCLRAPGYGLTRWCALGLLLGGAVQVPQSVTVTVSYNCNSIDLNAHSYSTVKVISNSAYLYFLIK